MALLSCFLIAIALRGQDVTEKTVRQPGQEVLMQIPTGELPKIPPKPKLTPWEQKLDPPLLELIRKFKTKGLVAARKAAGEMNMLLSRDRIAVKLMVSSEKDISLLKRRVRKVGGSITSVFENTLYAMLPVHGIEAIARESKVATLTVDTPIRLLLPQIVSEPVVSSKN